MSHYRFNPQALKFAIKKYMFATSIDGNLVFDKPLKKKHLKYLEAFYRTRRIAREPELTNRVKDPIRWAVNLPLGEESCYFVAALSSASNIVDDEMINAIDDYGRPPKGQPSLWCPWAPSRDGNELEIETKCSHNYSQWLQYLLDHFIAPWGYQLNGKVKFNFSNVEDNETLIVTNNHLEIKNLKAFT